MGQNEYWFYDDSHAPKVHVFLQECNLKDGKLDFPYPGSTDGRSYKSGTITYEGSKAQIKWPNGVLFRGITELDDSGWVNQTDASDKLSVPAAPDCSKMVCPK